VTSALPEDVHRFILSRIDSVEQLEVLLLMHRTPGTGWTPEAIARELYSTPSSVRGRLDALVRQELVSSEGSPSTFYYQPGAPELAATVDRTAECYRLRRVAMITLIASKPLENVRAFSDAFRFRKKDKD
jgi:hypothetical protein